MSFVPSEAAPKAAVEAAEASTPPKGKAAAKRAADVDAEPPSALVSKLDALIAEMDAAKLHADYFNSEWDKRAAAEPKPTPAELCAQLNAECDSKKGEFAAVARERSAKLVAAREQLVAAEAAARSAIATAEGSETASPSAKKAKKEKSGR